MEEVIKKTLSGISSRCEDAGGRNCPYTLFRIVVGALFFMHGAQKIFGLFGGAGGSGAAVPFGSLFWLAGFIEVVVGAVVLFGIFSRLGAAVAVVEMVIAYLKAHLPEGVNPLTNGGELALLFFVSFLVITWYGAGKLSLERYLLKRELF